MIKEAAGSAQWSSHELMLAQQWRATIHVCDRHSTLRYLR
jgi:hypothetical protein